jgi:hypothetical protein
LYKERHKGREGEKEDLSWYWMTLGKRENAVKEEAKQITQ